MSAFEELDYGLRREVDGIAAEMVRSGVHRDQARFLARRAKVCANRKVNEFDGAAADKERGSALASALEAAIVERYTLFAAAGGAPWDFYPIREHGQRLGEILQGVPEADFEEAMAPYLDPIKRDLMRRGFPEDEAEGWCEEIAGESGMWSNGPPPAEWLADALP